MSGLKIKEAKLVDELTEDCLFPISDGSGNPKVADFNKVKNFLGDTKQLENAIISVQQKINYLTRNGQDSGLSVKDIVEQILEPTSNKVAILIGNDIDKSARKIAEEVLINTPGNEGLQYIIMQVEQNTTNINTLDQRVGVVFVDGDNGSFMIEGDDDGTVTFLYEDNIEDAIIVEEVEY